MIRSLPAFICLAGLSLGCGGGQTAYMPLGDGAKWTYEASHSLRTSTITMKASADATVNGDPGFTLRSEMGQSVIGWSGGILYARELSGWRFDPPLPLLAPAKGKSEEAFSWNGQAYWQGRKMESSCTASQTQETIRAAGQRFSCLASIITLKAGLEEAEIITHFSSGRGIIRHQLRRRNDLELSLEYVSGP